MRGIVAIKVIEEKGQYKGVLAALYIREGVLESMLCKCLWKNSSKLQLIERILKAARKNSSLIIYSIFISVETN